MVEPYINATVDLRFKDALEEAKEADALVASGSMTRQQLAKEKPLLGVPFTVKVLLTVKGKLCIFHQCIINYFRNIISIPISMKKKSFIN